MSEFESYIRDFFPLKASYLNAKNCLEAIVSITRMVKDLEDQFSKEGIDEYTIFRYISLSVILSSSV